MSTLIVKNLPKKVSEERLRNLFSSHGQLTSCSLKYTPEGVFRKFAFVGYKDTEQAEAALKHFNKTYIDTCRIQVEIAKALGDAHKPRAWSKYSKDSSAYQKRQSSSGIQEQEKKPEKKFDILSDLKDDPQFEEFVDAHKSRSNKALWSNDTLIKPQDKLTTSKIASEKPTKKLKQMGSEQSDGDSDQNDASDTVKSSSISDSKIKTDKTLTDLQYLKSKVSNSNNWSDSEDSGNDSRDDSDTTSSGSASSETEDNSTGTDSNDDISDDDDDAVVDDDEKQEEQYNYFVKMKGLPVNLKESQIVDFFKPIKIVNMKIPKNAKGGKNMGVATVQFGSEADMELAMRRNKNFVGPKKIFLHKLKEKSESNVTKSKPRPWEEKMQNEEPPESIDESGRLFIRNLAYCCQEEDIETLFSKYGPLTEVYLPVDNLIKKIKGFAFVTYMFPEHAIKAFTELDGTYFQGRLLHILPAKEKKEIDLEVSDSMPFKKKQELIKKKEASSSHNWNTLFLGANAVADVMAEKYGTTKDHILSSAGNESVGVRLALGETQIVIETREFLLENGVLLDAFSQAASARSKTVMLAKNLPASTKAHELIEKFSKFGTLGRLLMPPSGVTAIVEFAEPTEAKQAFRNLAYTKFKDVPLYLEWAPMGVFDGKATVKVSSAMAKPIEKSTESADVKQEINVTETNDLNSKMEQDKDDDDDGEVEDGSVLFVKNINFATTEDSIQKHFEQCGKIRKVTISKKKDMKNIGKFLSMGFGFVTFVRKQAADKALKRLQHSILDDHKLEIKISTNATGVTNSKPSNRKKQDTDKEQKSTKILVRNIPFEATQHEVRELFKTFGELKFVRLPKKMDRSGSHRGFGFVDFITKEDAKRAFNALCHSTHLLGRRLVLEWAQMEENIDDLRRKTSDHYYDGPAAKKLKKNELMGKLNRITKFKDD